MDNNLVKVRFFIIELMAVDFPDSTIWLKSITVRLRKPPSTIVMS